MSNDRLMKVFYLLQELGFTASKLTAYNEKGEYKEFNLPVGIQLSESYLIEAGLIATETPSIMNSFIDKTKSEKEEVISDYASSTPLKEVVCTLLPLHHKWQGIQRDEAVIMWEVLMDDYGTTLTALNRLSNGASLTNKNEVFNNFVDAIDKLERLASYAVTGEFDREVQVTEHITALFDSNVNGLEGIDYKALITVYNFPKTDDNVQFLKDLQKSYLPDFLQIGRVLDGL